MAMQLPTAGGAGSKIAELRCCPEPKRCIAESTHRGARTHDHKVKSLALCRLS